MVQHLITTSTGDTMENLNPDLFDEEFDDEEFEDLDLDEEDIDELEDLLLEDFDNEA